MLEAIRLDRTLIRVAGPDAIGFLNNLLTQNIERLQSEPVVYAGLLTPQGKVVTDMFVWADIEGVVLDVDPARGPALLQRLTLYKLRAAVTLEDVSAARAIFVGDAIDGPSDPRLAALGRRALGEPGAPGDATPCHARRISLGVPDLVLDAAPEEVFAGEALFDELNAVDFQKGCFVGQENVSRMKRRATTRKKFCRVAFDGPAPAPGTPILAGAADLGSIRSGQEGSAIALLRLDRALEAPDQALAAEGRPIRLDPPDWLILPQRNEG